MKPFVGKMGSLQFAGGRSKTAYWLEDHQALELEPFPGTGKKDGSGITRQLYIKKCSSFEPKNRGK